MRIVFISLMTLLVYSGCKARPEEGSVLENFVVSEECTKDWREVDYRIVPFPDLGAKYLSYQFKIPAGKPINLRLSGDFPTARYMSYHVYDQVTEDAISSILDETIQPNAGSTNPYKVGQNRYADKRAYTVYAGCENDTKTPPNFLKLPCSADRDRLVDVWFRVYLNEKELIPPKVEVADTCPQVVLKDDSIATVETAIGDREPAPFIRGRVPLPFENGDVHFFRPQSTALGANEHVRYLSTRLDGKNIETPRANRFVMGAMLRKKGVINNIGDITILKFRSPTFPNTQKGLRAFTGAEDVRYWSVCVSGESTDASNCLSDAEFQMTPCEGDGLCAVLVIGPDDPGIESRVKSLGYNHLHHSKHKSPLLFYRQMLARPGFVGRIENIPLINPKDFADPLGASAETFQTPPLMVQRFFADTTIGAYAPTGRQCFYDEHFFERFCN